MSIRNYLKRGMRNSSSLLRSPKKEDQQLVPDTNNNNQNNFDSLEDLRGFLGINNNNNVDNYDEDEEDEEGHEFLSWDFTSSSWEVDQVLQKDQELEESFNICCDDQDTSVKKEDVIIDINNNGNNNYVGFWGESITSSSSNTNNNVVEDSKASLNLNLNYEDVLEAWSNRGPLWAYHGHHHPSHSASNNPYLGEVPNLEDERTRRETSVLRYKEKRQSRLFSKKIRYEVRKQNADKRPRLKGRFVKRGSDNEIPK